MEHRTTGTVQGMTIQLDFPVGVQDGQTVEITVRPLNQSSNWGDGIKRSAGGWQDFPEIDTVMDQVHAQRKLERRTAG